MKVLKDYGTVGKYQAKKLIWEQEDAAKIQGAAFQGQPVLDIRYYEAGEPKQGVALTEEMLATLMLLISRIEPRIKASTQQPFQGQYKNIKYSIYDVYGTLYEGNNFNIVFTKTNFNENGIKFDIRPWLKDLSGFMLGLSLTKEEFDGRFTEIIMQADTDFELCYPRLLEPSDNSKISEACFAELVYQFDKMGVCFGNKEKFNEFYEATRDFIRNWPNGKPASYTAER